MIVITGTKRSGTSMWMQIMSGGGFQIVGDEFPGIWADSIRNANPRGFFESRFRRGVYFATNPDPETGNFFQPKQIRRHVVKIFIPGMLRTDFGYISAVVATLRHWRDYTASLLRLYAMEDAYQKEHGIPRNAESNFAPDEAELLVKAGRIPPPLEWWFENYDLIRDYSVRKYPFHMVTYDRLLRNPGDEITKVFQWLGEGDLSTALPQVHPELRTQDNPTIDLTLVSDFVQLFDEFYDTIDKNQALSSEFVHQLNETNDILMKRWKDIAQERLIATRVASAHQGNTRFNPD